MPYFFHIDYGTINITLFVVLSRIFHELGALICKASELQM